MTTKFTTAKQKQKLLDDVKASLTKGVVEVDSKGNIVTDSSGDENPEETARRSQLKKARTWYGT